MSNSHLPPTEHWQMLRQDALYALRVMIKNPGFALLGVITLALGVGVNTAVFSAVRGVVLQPLPYTNGQDIVILHEELQKKGVADTLFSVPEINDYRDQVSTLSDLVEYHRMRFTLLGQDRAERVRTGVVSFNYFDFFGVKPILGRNFEARDEKPGAPPVILLSSGFWRNHQFSDPNIVGKNFVMNDKVHTVIGVLPPFPQYPAENDVYMTTSSCPFRSSPMFIEGREHRMMNLFARRKPGIAQTQVNSELSLISRRLEQRYPGFYPPGAGYRAVAASLSNELTAEARPVLWMLVYEAVFVLFIACANLANLTLARLARREQELAVRTALGASRNRLVRQLFTESAMLGLVAAVLSVAFAVFSHGLLVQFVSRFTPRALEINIDGWVLLFAILAALLTSILSGSAAAFFSETSMAEGLKDATRGSTAGPKRIRSVLVVAQVAFSFALLIGAGLMLRSFVKLESVNPGFSGEHVLTMAIDLNWSNYVTEAQQRRAGRSILEAVQALPGVSSAAISSTFPLDPDIAEAGGPTAFSRTVLVRGDTVRKGDTPPVGTIRIGSPGYFKTLGIRLVRGREFLATDNENARRVVIVNQTFVEHRLHNGDLIGQEISRNGGSTWATVVGVVANTREFDLSKAPQDEVYYPLDQAPEVGSLLIHTKMDPMALAERVRKAIHDFDPETVVANVESLESARQAMLFSPRVATSMLGIFAVLALVIAAGGIGGTLALSVNHRIKEIGVRMALGAERSDILAMVIRQGMLLVAVGLLFGLPLGVSMTAFLRSFLFQVVSVDPLSLAGVALLLGSVAFVACYVPARRATKVSPGIALRQD